MLSFAVNWCARIEVLGWPVTGAGIARFHYGEPLLGSCLKPSEHPWALVGLVSLFHLQLLWLWWDAPLLYSPSSVGTPREAELGVLAYSSTHATAPVPSSFPLCGPGFHTMSAISSFDLILETHTWPAVVICDRGLVKFWPQSPLRIDGRHSLGNKIMFSHSFVLFPVNLKKK